MNTESEHEKLILSEDFDRALEGGADIKSEIHGVMKQRAKSAYERFHELMLMSRDDIQAICDKRKKDRTPAEAEELKKFIKWTKMQYKCIKDMTFLSEEEKVDDNGVSNTVPKKVVQIADKIAAAVALLRYIGNPTLEDELSKRGVEVCVKNLEDISETFANENVRKDMISIFDDSNRIWTEIDDAERKIKEDIFVNMVPAHLQFDKQTNPSGLRDTDFKKLVEVKYRLLKSEQGDAEAKEKASEKAMDEAEKKTFEIERNKTIRTGLIALGAEEGEEESKENA